MGGGVTGVPVHLEPRPVHVVWEHARPHSLCSSAGYLPNGAHAVEAMLAAASIGAIWSSTSPDFGVNVSWGPSWGAARSRGCHGGPGGTGSEVTMGSCVLVRDTWSREVEQEVRSQWAPVFWFVMHGPGR